MWLCASNSTVAPISEGNLLACSAWRSFSGSVDWARLMASARIWTPS